MKQELAFALLLILASSFTLKESHQNHREEDSSCIYQTPLTNKWKLEFDHASRSGVPQNSNTFKVVFNGVTIKAYALTDYNIHHEVLNVRSRVGKNQINFIGTGLSDSLGQGIDNVKLTRTSFCGFQDVIVNGGFELGHTLGNAWAIFANGKIPGWSEVNGQLEIGAGRIYNAKWPENTHVAELDANKNSNVYQQFTLDKYQRLV